MIADLDTIMTRRGIGAVIVPMHELMHPSFRWMTRGAKVTKGYAIHPAGGETLLIHYPMERDEAAAAGVSTRSVHDFGHAEIFKSASNIVAAYGEFYDRVLRAIGAEGEVAFCGQLPAHIYLDLPDALRVRGWKVARLAGEDLIQAARKRKDQWELDQVASVGKRTEEVVNSIREVLRNAPIRGGIAQRNGVPLRLGDLKAIVSSEIARLGMVEDHETILSQGHDAGVPHSRGDAGAPVRASVPIVLDIFPADRSSGYFFDLTRTFCIGDIPSRLREIHGQVHEAFLLAGEKMRAGTKASDYQDLVCDFFEKRGHPTLRSDPTTTRGYVHGLGHGVGLEVHEKPGFHLVATNRDQVEVGDVLTIEPGLYYPEEEIGVRIEDTLYVAADGKVVTFCSSDRGLEP